MDEDIEEVRDLTVTEGTIKVVLAAAAAYLVKRLVENGVENIIRSRD